MGSMNIRKVFVMMLFFVISPFPQFDPELFRRRGPRIRLIEIISKWDQRVTLEEQEVKLNEKTLSQLAIKREVLVPQDEVMVDRKAEAKKNMPWLNRRRRTY